MRSIKEIGILIEQLNVTVGATQQILNGNIADPTSQKGSLEYTMNFDAKMRKIRGLYAQVEKTDQSPFTIEPDILANKYVELVNSFIALKKQNESNLQNWTIPLNDSPMLKIIAQQLYNDPTIDKLTFDQIKQITSTATSNSQPFIDGPNGGILNDSISISQTCASGSNDCAGPTEGMSIIKAIETYIKQNIVCALKQVPQLVGSSILKPLVKWLDSVRKIDDTWEKIANIALVAAVPVIGTQYLLPITLILLTDAVYMKLSLWYCSWAKQCGNTYDDDFRNICITSAHRARVHRFQLDTSIFSAYSSTYGSPSSTYWILEEGLEDISELTQDNVNKLLSVVDSSLSFYILAEIPIITNGEITSYTYLPCLCEGTTTDISQGKIALSKLTYKGVTTYNPFEKYPEIKSHALFDDAGKQRTEEIYDCALDGIGIHYIIINEPNTALCVQNTANANSMILYRMADMMLNPKKYGLEDPGDVIIFGAIKQNYDIVKGIGEFLKGTTVGEKTAKFSSSANTAIVNSLVSLTSEFGDVYNDMQEYLQQKIASASGVPTEIGWKFMDTLHETSSPLLFSMIDVLQETYVLYKELSSKDRMIEVFCCLLGELINDAVQWLQSKNLTITPEAIIDRISQLLDMFINTLKLIARLVSTDYLQMLNLLFGQVTGGIFNLISMAITTLYNTILTAIDQFLSKLGFQPEGMVACVPWDILLGFIKKLIYIGMRRFLQMFSIFIGKIQEMINLNGSLTGRIAFIQAITSYIYMLETLKANLGDLLQCLKTTSSPITGEFSLPVPTDITITNNGGSFMSGDNSQDATNSTYSDAYGIIYMTRASQAAGTGIYLNKERFSYLLDKMALADPVATLNYVKGRKPMETFEERKCTSSKIMTMKEILDYYKERL